MKRFILSLSTRLACLTSAVCIAATMHATYRDLLEGCTALLNELKTEK